MSDNLQLTEADLDPVIRTLHEAGCFGACQLRYPDVSARRRAFHEAGHAAVAVEVGISISKISIAEFGGGYCGFGPAINHDLETDFAARGEQFVIAILGGMEAEKRYTSDYGLPQGPGHPDAWLTDIRLVCMGLLYMRRHGLAMSSDWVYELSRLRLRVWTLLQSEPVWYGVEAITLELLQQSTVDGDRAERCYREAKAQIELADGQKLN